MMKNLRKAFTIVELVIAILIFWIWLLVILLVLNKSIVLAKKTQLKTQATFLAKEWMELVYNLRDSNKIKYYPWNYISWTIADIQNGNYQRFKTGTMYIPYILITGYKSYLAEISNKADARLFVLTWVFYDNVGNIIYSGFFYNYFTWKKTPFYRYVIFTGVYLQPEWKLASYDKLLKLNSKVFYSFWSLTWEIVFSSFIWDWR